MGDVGQIHSIAVSPRYRGLGVADRLLRHALNRSRDLGARTISLEVRPENVEAVQLYLKHGFTKAESLANYYQDGGTAERMVLGCSLPAGLASNIDRSSEVPRETSSSAEERTS
jgi:ribosomal protein S18 acetylase RimI-like enzyme